MAAHVPIIFVRRNERQGNVTKLTYVVVYHGRAESPADRVEEFSLEVPSNKTVTIGYDRSDGSIAVRIETRPSADVYIDATPATFPTDVDRPKDIEWLISTNI